MERVYVEVIKWKCENPNGTTVDIQVGDKVKVKYDEKQDIFGDFFLKYHPETEIIGTVTKVLKSKIKVWMDDSWHLSFYPKNIISIEKLDN